MNTKTIFAVMNTTCENKAWKIKACTGFEPTTSAIPMNDFHIVYRFSQA